MVLGMGVKRPTHPLVRLFLSYRDEFRGGCPSALPCQLGSCYHCEDPSSAALGLTHQGFIQIISVIPF